MAFAAENERHGMVRPDQPDAPALFRVEGLRLTLAGRDGAALVDGLSLDLRRGESLALIGESGCGKSLTCWSCIGLPPRGIEMTATCFQLGQTSLLRSGAPDAAAFARLRGKRIGMIFQDPIAALNPTRRIGSFLTAILRKNKSLTRNAARAEAIHLLESVGISKPGERMSAYPHELSGGQCQRVMIARALAGDPDMIIADEPTTALDVTMQAQIMALLDDLRRNRGLGLLIVTHDLGVVAQYADRVMVMYAGRIVEEGHVEDVLAMPRHPYTQGLLASLPPEHGKRPLTPIPGTVPELAAQPDGCAFAPRCPRALPETCMRDVPRPDQTSLHRVACWNSQEVFTQ